MAENGNTSKLYLLYFFSFPLASIKDLSIYSKWQRGLDLAEKGFALRLTAVSKILLGEWARTLCLPIVSTALNMARMNRIG